MAILRGKSKSKRESVNDVKLTARDVEQYKPHATNVHDPILTAVNEAQPFEEAANAHGTNGRRPSYLSQESSELRDIFGQPIAQSDVSNPTRARNERPMDTIRSFEYAITGDLTYRDQLESRNLGWGFHEDFPYYNMSDLNHQDSRYGAEAGGFQRPAMSFGDGVQPIYQANNYSASSLQADGGKAQKKKKKGLFGRKS
ncbi:uncharacterized protein KQ657_000397 [Scheffersomyces spartinae]|uniref:Uncharacterized protein n=1 Tax=Scheffersomyces spartinae TaxID=45513 RepID=A0A9P8AHT6_9ASCO|nr:uncharacterized protein KQ657_000397 [Scheffersomyces spartinae]KAG7193707.1 hypothetical protein KQ657_000397 [Scheffersomyces spartinae]